MSLKSKGINAERDLIHKFWSFSVPAVRIAGSGSIKYPCPDIIAGNRSRKIVIESKVTKEKQKYFMKKEIEELKKFGNMFGAEPWVALKFKNIEWLFLPINELKSTSKGYSINIETARLRGILFEELIKNII